LNSSSTRRTLSDVFESYLSACRSGGDAEASFRASLVAQRVVKPGSEGSIRYVKPTGLDGIPYVCIRIPTGGGKTILASYAIERARKAFLQTDFPSCSGSFHQARYASRHSSA